MFNIEQYKEFIESKIVYIGTRKDSIKKHDIIAFCCQWTKTSTGYFGSTKTATLQKIFGNNLAHKPSGMSINTYFLLEYGYKRCASCSEILVLHSFCKNSAEAIGYNSKCRECVSQLRKLEAAKVNALTAKRRANKKHAEPKWLTSDQKSSINNFYTEAKNKTIESGIPYQVDHIVPLQGKNVCGLHVPWNLQVITATDNQRKGAKVYE